MSESPGTSSQLYSLHIYNHLTFVVLYNLKKVILIFHYNKLIHIGRDGGTVTMADGLFLLRGKTTRGRVRDEVIDKFVEDTSQVEGG